MGVKQYGNIPLGDLGTAVSHGWKTSNAPVPEPIEGNISDFSTVVGFHCMHLFQNCLILNVYILTIVLEFEYRI